MKVTIPSPLLSYTGAREIRAPGATVGEVLHALDARYPGLRFRMVDEQDQLRQHMRLFLDSEEVQDLATPVHEQATLHIVQALSGG